MQEQRFSFVKTTIITLLICSSVVFCKIAHSFSKEIHIPKVDLLNNTFEEEGFLWNILSDDTKSVPDELDWRDVDNKVTPVRDEHYCKSSWAFAAVGVLEGQELVVDKNLKKIVELSEQNLIDCLPQGGCEPKQGSIKEAILQVVKQNGIDLLRTYPYDERKATCRYKKDNAVLVGAIKGAAVLPPNEEEKLKQVVAKYGPVGVQIHDTGSVDPKSFSLYRSGIFKGSSKCSQSIDKLDTALLIVGYGVDDQDGDFWIVKNSVSRYWGYAGYGLIARGNNTCGLATAPVIATY